MTRADIDTTSLRDGLRRLFPILRWTARYRRDDLRYDLIAGVTLAAFAIPESLAYASLAGVPAQTGLYAGLVAALTYAVLGSSRLLACGVTSALAVLTAGTVGSLAHGDASKAAELTAFATLIAGAAALIAWACRLGFLANLVSRTVLTGFSFGAGLYIASTQLAKLFGIPSAGGEFFGRLAGFFGQLGETHVATLVVGATALSLLAIGKLYFPRLPNALIVVLLAIVAAPLMDLPQHGVKVVGHIPRGLPTPTLGEPLAPWSTLLPLGLSMFVLSYVEGVSAARSLAARHGGSVDVNQELLANAAGNLGSGLFRGMPVGGSLTRSAVSVEVGARTPLAGAVSGMLMLLVIALLTSVFQNLPEAVLAAVILVAVIELVDVHAMRRLFALSTREGAIATISALGVLTFGMLWGVLIGVAVSLLDLLERIAFPHTAVLGRIPGSDAYGDVARHPENQRIEGVLIMRVDASLVFANAHGVKQDILERLTHHGRAVRLLILDLEASALLDLAGAEMLEELAAMLEERGINVQLAGVTARARNLLRADAPQRFADLEPGLEVSRVVRAWTTPARPSAMH